MATPVESRHQINGAELCLFEWPGEDPPVLFVHATSMHARCWDQVIQRLLGRHAYSVDMRGHGRSTVHDPPYDWRRFGEDVAELARALDLQDAVGVGHSMGGHAVTLAAALEPRRFGALLLVDAVITDRQRKQPAGEQPRAMTSTTRKSSFASPDEMFERYHDRSPFDTWDRAALRDYCEYGLLPAADGDGFTLACPPDIELAVYAGMSDSDIFDEIATITAPVRVLRARDRQDGEVRFGSSTTPPDLASRFSASVAADDVQLHDNSHHIPMESPEVVTQHVEEMAAAAQRRRG